MNTKRITYFIIILLVITIFGCTDKKINENEVIARSFIEAWSTHDIDKLSSLFSEDCLYEEVATGRKYTTIVNALNSLASERIFAEKNRIKSSYHVILFNSFTIRRR